jgi:hypothetical protein
MTPVKQLQRRYGRLALLLAIVAAVIFLLFGLKPVARGLVLGTVFSILNFVLIGQLLPLKFEKSKGRRYIFSLGSTALRFLLLSVPLILAVKSSRFDLVATVVGIFMIQIVVLIDHTLGYADPANG